MDLFEAVKASVTARQAAERYGIRVTKNGMCVCPFHKEKKLSMKVDQRFHCYVCQADGDVISLVSRLKGIRARDAALMLAKDFSVPYDANSGRTAYGSDKNRYWKVRKESPEQKFKRIERHYYKVLSDYHFMLLRWKEQYAPKPQDGEMHPLYLEAVQRVSLVEYLLDVLLYGEVWERRKLLVEYKQKVHDIEQHMEEMEAEEAFQEIL